ncbi:MAG TPA: ABC transporter substrate-binding protein [Anaeromyxobacteraceae bacterium]|nr:ABC transporter substrate-binding protein [Anaeromyxobacteraceae bacterium]
MVITSALLALALSAGDGNPIKIGGYFPLTGGYAATGTAMRNAARLAVDEVNAAGGVLGRKLVVLEADDAGSPQKAAQIVQDYVEKEKVAALLGPAQTGVAAASTRTANEKKVPHVVSNAVGNKVNELFKEFPDNYVFRLAASEALQAEMMVTEAFAARGKRKPAILHDETAHGQGGRARLASLLGTRGVKPVHEAGVKPGEDASAQVKAAKDAGADVILLFALAKEGAAVSRALEKVGWKAEVIGTSSLSSSDFTQAAGPFGEGTTLPQTVIEAGAVEPAQKAFFAAYRKAYGVERVEPAPGAAQTYDAVKLLALAMKQAGTTDGPKVKAALEDLGETYDGATSTYFKPFGPDDHEAVSAANMMWGELRGGQVVPQKAP